MVNGKKVIAVCVSRANNQENLAYLRAFHSLAKERGYLMAAYFLTSDVFLFGEDVKKDAGVFSMINYDYVDALVVIRDDLMTEDVIRELIGTAKENNIPRVVIGAGCDDAFTVEYQGDDCFEAIVRHIVEEHGCKNVYFMAGVPDKEFSYMWVDVYRRVLEENGIEFDENKVGFGYYWSDPAYKIVEEWLKRPQVPEAIICANDVMAIATCKCLNEHGYYVPENILVTGFDGIKREQYHFPRLTTGVRDEVSSCEMAIEFIDNVFGGMPFSPIHVKQQYNLKISQSCGCEAIHAPKMNGRVNVLYDTIGAFDSHESFIYKMGGALSGVSDKDEMFNLLSVYLWDNAYIILRDRIWEVDDGAEEELEVGYDEEVTLIRYNKIPVEGQKDIFPMGIYLPDYKLMDSQQAFTSVFPIRYKERIFGYYVVFSDGEDRGIYCSNRFVNMVSVTINTVLGQHKLSITNKRLAGMQIRDSLTGIYNSRGFISEVKERYLDNPQGRKMIIVALDIDRLRAINETFGHDEGDVAITSLADIIKSGSSVEDVCARYGTDEFLCAVFTTEDPDYMVFSLLNNILASVKNHNTLYDKPYTLVINHDYVVGMPENVEDVNNLVKLVLEKKQQKKDRRNSGSSADNDEKSEEEQQDYDKFCQLIKNNLFRYAFQPIVSAKSGEIFAYEALMRTCGGIDMSPIRIIDIATKYNRLKDVERATVNNVVEFVDDNLEKFNGRKIFINSIISAILSREEASELIEAHKRLAKYFVVEVTEQTSVEHESYKKVVSFLNEAGIDVAIDDYGTGYANTSRIIDCIPQYIKIDRSLISGIHFDYRKQHFVSNIIEYAHDNGFMALAEGVENASELKAVIRMGIDLIQGYYTARPLFEIVDSIDEGVRQDMLRYAKRQNAADSKKAYITGQDTQIDVYELMINMYSEVIVTGSEVVFTGRPEYNAAMNFKLENNKDYVLTFRDVYCDYTEETKGIAIGENSNVTLIFEGKNKFIRGGIFIPKSSSLKMKGEGSLHIECHGPDQTCIGGGADSHGSIDINMPGGLTLDIECDEGAAIGGVSNQEKRRINITDTDLLVKTATAKSVGVGSLYGDSFVRISGGNLKFEMRSRQSVAIGSVDEKTEVYVKGAEIHVANEGDMIAGIGTLSSADNRITLKDTRFSTVVRGKYINCIGADGGENEINLKNSLFDLFCEGASVLGYGTRALTGSVTMEDCEEILNISSGEPMLYAVAEDKLKKICNKKEATDTE